MARVTKKPVQITTADRVSLHGTVFGQAGTGNGRGVILNSAVGVWHKFYEPFAFFLAERGFVVLTYDYRGIGSSQPETLSWRQLRMSDWGERDIAAAIDYLHKDHPARELSVVGHSAGCQLFGLAHNNHLVSRLLGVGAGTGHFGDYPMPARAYLWSLWHLLVPAVAPLLGYFPGRPFGLGDRLPAGVVLQWARWGRDRHYLLGKHRPDSARYFGQFSGAFLSFGFEDDTYAPPSAVAALLRFYPNATTTHRRIRPADAGAKSIGHMGFFRKRTGDTLWTDAANWLENVD